MAAGCCKLFAALLLASWGSISEGVRRTLLDAGSVIAPNDTMQIGSGNGSGSGSGNALNNYTFYIGSGNGSGSGSGSAFDNYTFDIGGGDGSGSGSGSPCAAWVAGATGRDSAKFPSCKCEDSGSWWSGVSVYCGDQVVAGRKFNATEVVAQCASPYCARSATETTTLSEWERTSTIATTATTTTTTTTTTRTTTTTFDASVTVDASPLFAHDKKFKTYGYGIELFKCCVHSQTNEVVVQNITNGDHPRARTLCIDTEGCGCMFGDHWHSFDADSPCVVTYHYLSEKIRLSPENFSAMLS